MKKIISLLAAASLILSAGCSSKSSGEMQDNVLSQSSASPTFSVAEQLVYQQKAIDLGETICAPKLMEARGDTAYYFYINADHCLMLTKMDAEGNMIERTKLIELTSFDSTVDLGDDGSFTVFYSTTDFPFEYDENGYISNYVDYLENGEAAVRMARFDSGCKLIDDREIEGMEKYFSPSESNLVSAEEYCGGWILSIHSCVLLIDEKAQIADTSRSEGLIRFSKDTQGNVIAVDPTGGFSVLNGKTLTIPEPKFRDVLNISMSPPETGRDGYRAFFATIDGLMGLTENNEVIQLMDYLGSSIEKDVFGTGFCCLGDGVFMTGEPAIYTRRPDDYVAERQEIRLCGQLTNPDYAMEFNRENDRYFVTQTQFTDVDDISKKMLIGEAPDIVVLQGGDDMHRLANLGGLVDLNELLDSDKGLNKEDIMPNVLKAYTYRGALCALPEYYYINLMIANRDFIDQSMKSWSYADFLDIYNSRPEGMKLFWNDSAYSIFRNNSYIDYENGTCCADDPDFVRTLEVAKELGDSMRFMDYDDNDAIKENVKGMFLSLKEHTAMLKPNVGAMSCDELIREAAYSGLSWDEASFLYYPSFNGRGIMSSNVEYAITRGGKVDGAWEFVSYILSEDKQDRMMENGWNVVNRRSFEKITPDFVVSDGSVQMGKGTYDDVEIEYVSSITPEQYREYVDLLLGYDSIELYDCDIFFDEYGRMMDGEISAEECAKYIQDRTEIMLSERS